MEDRGTFFEKRPPVLTLSFLCIICYYLAVAYKYRTFVNDDVFHCDIAYKLCSMCNMKLRGCDYIAFYDSGNKCIFCLYVALNSSFFSNNQIAVYIEPPCTLPSSLTVPSALIVPSNIVPRPTTVSTLSLFIDFLPEPNIILPPIPILQRFTHILQFSSVKVICRIDIFPIKFYFIMKMSSGASACIAYLCDGLTLLDLIPLFYQ